jgi:hypothetical protein
MLRRIRSHNILNGMLFSIFEFGFTALIIAPFAVYYIIHGKLLYATISVGIILNCLTIVMIGLIQLRQGEKDLGLRPLYNKNYREQVARENPHLFGDTMLLVATILLPFALLALTLGEWLVITIKQE